MTGEAIEVDYAPTAKELRRGTMTMIHGAFGGVWRWAQLLVTGLRSLAVAVGVCVLGVLIAGALGGGLGAQIDPLLALPLMLALVAVAIGGAMLLILRWHGRQAAGFAEAAWRLRIDPQGLELRNDRSRLFLAWRDVDLLREGRGGMAALTGLTGYVIPDRLLATEGEPKTLRARIRAWHDAARTAET